MLILKTAGNCVDDMKLTFGGIKFALGENPKSVYHGRDEMPFTRMATAAIIREGLYKAKRYLEQWEAVEEAEDQMMQSAKPCCHCCEENTRHIFIVIVQMI